MGKIIKIFIYDDLDVWFHHQLIELRDTMDVKVFASFLSGPK